MNFKLFIGVDTAKEKYDLAQFTAQGELLNHELLENNNVAVAKWLDELLACHTIQAEEILLCVEQTGIYTKRLTYLAHEKGLSVWLVDAYHLNRSIGRVNAKTDKVDAINIAKYAQRNYQDFTAFAPTPKVVEQIKSLEGQRRRMQKVINQLLVPINEEIDNVIEPLDKSFYQHSKEIIKRMKLSLKKIDAQIDQVIDQDDTLRKNRKIATSVPAFGKVNYRNLVCETHGFTRLLESRKLAANIGIAPYPKQSGKSLNRGPRIPKMSNNQFKSDLTCGVRSIVKSNNRFGRYYRRKREEENKPHFVVVNNLRNKIIHTVLACVKNQTMYNENYA